MTDEISPENSTDQILSILSETNWSETFSESLRDKRDQLYPLLGLVKPQVKSTTPLPKQTQPPPKSADDDGNYQGKYNSHFI
jgi:hypothetical protein